MIPGVGFKSTNARTVVRFTKVEDLDQPDIWVIEPMHFLTLKEAKRQADAALPWARKAGLL